MAQSSKKSPSYKKEEKISIVKEPTTYFTSNSTSSFSPSLQRSIAIMGMSDTNVFKKIKNDVDFIDCIREGVPKIALDNLVEVAGFSTNEIATIIRTSDRTLRRYTSRQKLNAEQSERVIEIAKLYSLGEEVFGSMDAFKTWMDRRVITLGNKMPKEYLDTSLGIDMLMDELGRIAHGVFA